MSSQKQPAVLDRTTETQTKMPNQIDPDRKRAVFIIDRRDYNTLEGYGSDMGFTASVLMREAVYRLAEEIRQKGATILIRQPKPNEGHATQPKRLKKDE